MNNNIEDFKRVKEIAFLLRVNPITVYGYIQAGELTAVKIGRSYRVEWSEFLRFIDRHKTNNI